MARKNCWETYPEEYFNLEEGERRRTWDELFPEHAVAFIGQDGEISRQTLPSFEDARFAFNVNKAALTENPGLLPDGTEIVQLRRGETVIDVAAA
jgi:hypothetical protein